MPYLDMRKAFHDPSVDEAELLKRRLEDAHTVKLGTLIEGSEAFACMVPEVYGPLLEAASLDKEIAQLEASLPKRALDSYRNSCLIDEIVLTNEIEGVHSTRREIGEVLENLKKNDRRHRFSGIVLKYALLQTRPDIPVATCADIRAIYNDLVLGEIEASDPTNVPDGAFFRAKGVHVVNEADIPIHQGMEPESKIIAEMERALATLSDPSLPALVRISLFHFLFGFIHPFYDGNGRTNRFISSYLIAKEYEPLVGLGISYSIKQEIEKYYKGFSVCEHPLNRGDVTPFVIAFSEICVDAMRNLRDSLVEKKGLLADYEAKATAILPAQSLSVSKTLITATLFTFDGITAADLAESEGVSRPTLYKRLAPLRDKGLLLTETISRKTFYKLDADAFLSQAAQ